MADTVIDSLHASNYSGIQLMPQRRRGRRRGVAWGLPVPRTGSPRPRQEDCVPLHPLLKSFHAEGFMRLVGNMQRRPGRDRGSDSIRTRRTQPALPGATMPTVRMVVPSRQYPAGLYEPQSPAKKRPNYGQRALLQLLSSGLILEMLFLALYPLLAGVTTSNDAAKQAWLGLFPWISRLYWTRAFPGLVQLLTQVPGFNLTKAGGSINFLVLLLALSFVLVLIAGHIGSRIAQE